MHRVSPPEGPCGSMGVDAIGRMVRDACVPWRAEPTPSASPVGQGGLHCGRRRRGAGSKQAEGRRDAGVWMLAHAYGMCVGGWRAVQVVPVGGKVWRGVRRAPLWSQQASLVVDATG